MDLHLEMTDAARPASRAVQSKNMWNESEIRPRLKTDTDTHTIRKPCYRPEKHSKTQM